MKLVFLLFIFAFISCQTKPISHDLDAVSLGTDQNEKNLQIDESNKGSYGPQKDFESKKVPREPVIALIHYPSLYHSQTLITYLKQLENNSVNISIISSFGFGGLLSALYAKQKSVSYLEWKLFGLLKKIKDQKPYSDGWRETLNDFIDEEFKELKCNQLKVLLVFPQKTKSGIKLEYTGKIAPLLKEYLNLVSSKNLFTSFFNYKNTLKKKLSADIIQTVGFLPTTPVLTTLRSIEYGIYTSYLGKLLTDSVDLGILLAQRRAALDEISLINDLDAMYSDLVDKNIQSLNESLTLWKEDNSGTSNN